MDGLYLGIDPGGSGGVALVGPSFAQAWKLDQTEADVADILRSHRGAILKAYIEAVGAFPGQGVVSSFTFGRSYGFLRGLLVALQIPFEEIRPQKWQKFMGCLTGGDKNISKAKAQQLWPHLKITHATADALLIGEACRRSHETQSRVREPEEQTHAQA